MFDAAISDDACKQLWCEVLERAIVDAKAKRPTLKRDKDRKRAERDHKQALRDWQDARDYIGSRSFRQVCWLCGHDPDVVEGRVRKEMT